MNDFSLARNFSLSHANHEWTLILDADERIQPQDWEKLKLCTRALDKRWFSGSASTSLQDWSGRLGVLQLWRLLFGRYSRDGSQRERLQNYLRVKRQHVLPSPSGLSLSQDILLPKRQKKFNYCCICDWILQSLNKPLRKWPVKSLTDPGLRGQLWLMFYVNKRTKRLKAASMSQSLWLSEFDIGFGTA